VLAWNGSFLTADHRCDALTRLELTLVTQRWIFCLENYALQRSDMQGADNQCYWQVWNLYRALFVIGVPGVSPVILFYRLLLVSVHSISSLSAPSTVPFYDTSILSGVWHFEDQSRSLKGSHTFLFSYLLKAFKYDSSVPSQMIFCFSFFSLSCSAFLNSNACVWDYGVRNSGGFLSIFHHTFSLVSFFPSLFPLAMLSFMIAWITCICI